MTRTDGWKKPTNQAELVAYRAAVRAEAFSDAAQSVESALRTGRDAAQAVEQLRSFDRINRDEASYYAPAYVAQYA